MKKAKIILTIFVLLLSVVSLSFAADTSEMLISSNPNQEVKTTDTVFSDLSIGDENEYELKNIINGNVFSSVSTLNINPEENGGKIIGNLFAIGKQVNIKSDVTYSETEKDELGNLKIQSINKHSIIDGNVFITADSFNLEPGCEINGDLFICANKIELSQSAKINGNVFAVSNNLIVNSQINGDLYASVKNFDMKYYGFVSRDLHLSASKAIINGYIYRNSFIEAEKIEMQNKFINEKNLTIKDASSVEFAGQVKRNATINTKKIEFNSASTCEILGDLKYSSNNEIKDIDKYVSGAIVHGTYENTNSINLGKQILNFVITFVSFVLLVLVVYFIINKLSPDFVNKMKDLKISQFIIAALIGLLVLIALVLIIFVLLLLRIGSMLALFILVIFLLLLIISKSIFIIAVSAKLNDKLNKALSIILIALAISVLELIPFIGSIISACVPLCGIGILFKKMISKK